MPSLRATALAVVRLSPVSMTTRMPSAASAFSASGVDALTGSAMANSPASLPSTAMKIAVAPSRAQASRLALPATPVSMPSAARKLALPSTTVLPSTLPVAPLPVGESNPRPCRVRGCVPAPPRTIASASGCSLARSTLAASRRTSASSKPSAGTIADHLRLAFGQRAGLVDHQRVDLLHPLQRFGVLDQHAGLRAAADADHDRHRRGQAERAGAGDDQHAHGRDQAEGQARLGPEQRPGREGDQRHRDHRRHEPAGDLIGQPLDRRARALRLRHHLDDLRQHRVAADLVGAHHEAAGLVERAAR